MAPRSPHGGAATGSPARNRLWHPRTRRAAPTIRRSPHRRSRAAAPAVAARSRCIVDRQLVVAAPQAPSTGQRTRSRSGRTSSRTSAFDALTVFVCRAGPSSSASTSSAPAREGRRRPSGRRRPAWRKGGFRRSAAGAARSWARLHERGDRQRVAGVARRPTRCPRQPPSTSALTVSGRRIASRGAIAPPSEWPTTAAGVAPSCSSTRPSRSAYGLSDGAAGERRGAAMPGELGHDQPPARQQQRREREPVRGRAAEPVDEQQRVALAGDQVAQPAAASVEEPLFEPRRLCVRHEGRLFFAAMDRSGRQDP